MAHLSIEFSAGLDDLINMQHFCETARKAMADSKTFPIAGIRVRAFRADYSSLADGGAEHHFVDMVLRMGRGRSEAEKQNVVEAVYSTLQNWLQGQINSPFALSLELLEINAPFAEKRLNTIRPALIAKGIDNA